MADERNYYVLCADNCKFPAMTKEQTLAAIAQAIETGEIKDVDAGFVTKLKEQNGGAPLMFWVGTQAQYNEIAEKVNNCFYIITDDTTYDDVVARVEEAVNIANSAAEVAGEAFHITSVEDTILTDALLVGGPGDNKRHYVNSAVTIQTPEITGLFGVRDFANVTYDANTLATAEVTIHESQPVCGRVWQNTYDGAVWHGWRVVSSPDVAICAELAAGESVAYEGLQYYKRARVSFVNGGTRTIDCVIRSDNKVRGNSAEVYLDPYGACVYEFKGSTEGNNFVFGELRACTITESGVNAFAIGTISQIELIV